MLYCFKRIIVHQYMYIILYFARVSVLYWGDISEAKAKLKYKCESKMSSTYCTTSVIIEVNLIVNIIIHKGVPFIYHI